MRKTRQRREPEEELPVSNREIEATPEENELNDFLGNLGPEGVSEVCLYRVLTSGKRVFVTSGPPSQFSELSVQTNYGAGDYIARAKLNGQWFRSKSFSVEAAPGTAPSSVAAASSELDRVRLELEAQRMRLERQQTEMEANRREQQAQIEADRREREQRNHELQLKMLESFGNRGNDSSSIATMIEGVRTLKDLSSGNGPDPLAALNQSLEAVERISALRSNGDGTGGGFWSEFKPVIVDVARAFVPAITSIIAAATAKPNGSAAAAGSVAPAMNPALPTLPVQPAAIPIGATPQERQPAAIPPSQAAQPAGTPAAGAAPTSTAIPQNVLPPEDEFQAYKTHVIQFALPFALQSRDPELYAALAFEQMQRGDVGIARLLEEMNVSKDFDPWFADLLRIEPTINSQRDWFSDFYKAVRAIITSQREEEHGK